MSDRQTLSNQDSSASSPISSGLSQTLPPEPKLEIVLPRRISTPQLGQETVTETVSPLEIETAQYQQLCRQIISELGNSEAQLSTEFTASLHFSFRSLEARLDESALLSSTEKVNCQLRHCTSALKSI